MAIWNARLSLSHSPLPPIHHHQQRRPIIKLAQGTINVVSPSVSSNKLHGLTCQEYVVEMLYLAMSVSSETIFIIEFTVKLHAGRRQCHIFYCTVNGLLRHRASFSYIQRCVIYELYSFKKAKWQTDFKTFSGRSGRTRPERKQSRQRRTGE